MTTDEENVKLPRTTSGGSRHRRLTIGRGSGGGKASPSEREEEEAPWAALKGRDQGTDDDERE